MSLPAIRVEGLGKRYRIGHQVRHDTLRDSLWQALRGILPGDKRGPRPDQEDFWALKDVSFDVQPGEVVGIVGRNGAGKSTLLKVLSRITEPSEGRVTLRGRIASLLEVGTGFHPELSGRENIFLNGAILGMSRTEIAKKFDEIVAFAEVEKFLDTPVKHYSSGMYVRLAFAVAAHLDPEILIVDEVLAVGDSEFQKKCLGKMSEVTSGGRTVLFVSHNLTAVRSLCSRAIHLSAGRCVGAGPVATILSEYARPITDASVQYQRQGGDVPRGPCVTAARFVTSSGEAHHETSRPLELQVDLHTAGNAVLVVGLHLFDAQFEEVIHSSSQFAPALAAHADAKRSVTVTIPAFALNVGEYRCNIVIAEQNVAIYERLEDTLGFVVVDSSFPGPGDPSSWNGTCSPRLPDWRWRP